MIRLNQILFEQNDLTEYHIVNIDGCWDNSFDVELENGEQIECDEIANQFDKLFRESGVRIMSNENPYSALIDLSGKLFGGIIVSYELPEDMEEVEFDGGNVTFSIVINQNVRGKKFAEKMIVDLIKNKRRSVIKAQVINPLMEKILIGLGFEKISESGSANGLVYKLLPNHLKHKSI